MSIEGTDSRYPIPPYIVQMVGLPGSRTVYIYISYSSVEKSASMWNLVSGAFSHIETLIHMLLK